MDEAVEAIANLAANSSLPEVQATQDAALFSAESDTLTSGEDDELVVISGAEDPEIEVTSRHGSFEISGALPGTAADSSSGDIVYSDASDYNVVPLAHSDGSLQINLVLENTDAPTRFDFDYSAEGGASLELTSEGFVVILDGVGAYLGGIDPAWAFDANGREVPTHFEVRGSSLTQVVDHTSSNFAYPIVADPWQGGNLFHTITVTSEARQARVNLTPSTWGRVVWTGASTPNMSPVVAFAKGQQVLNTQGWSEAVHWSSKVAVALNKPSQRQQFECHALGGVFDVAGGGVWNLEKWRPNRTKHWSVAVARHVCNWHSAGGK
ncbi:DUF2599 domain-containing protein [Humidisolicoccus flavus]|uniref:DUF2599 domain-containing protein n=1 Tax=Humidisolicoccus flavus TaxID=3111414 RepID=UPI0032532F49